MKVILMQKVERLGEPGQQVDVADGYARNFLLPKQLAVPATPGHLKSLGQLTAQSKNREERTKRDATALAERLAAVQITLRRRASEEEAAGPGDAAAPAVPAADAPRPGEVARPARLFGSVTAQDVSQALSAQGLTVDKKQILLTEPIKTLGAHRVPVRLHTEVMADLTVTIEREA
ncbi:MAG: 50S ribosomal protein L9 [candidate division NC10 bacterium]|nr:50S ribosomal protein L9 [candidate division NC10 bacterium]MBI2116362.1 50S ribosomal protein L9 [candidate division NC10 bacterium]MBI2163624.1 50S ribosomal protein L9 [candidate division NC10 bacterium]MBI2458259.1 50S ribosomal protein L9 [candidate division NC10 bacterium]MBI3084922.1 50S ribosomal protein L9 [candidate division NC10 bacterium]